eukprot:SAG31_NODE_1274_length_9050_cov_10.910178_10_plen_117_part_00
MDRSMQSGSKEPPKPLSGGVRGCPDSSNLGPWELLAQRQGGAAAHPRSTARGRGSVRRGTGALMACAGHDTRTGRTGHCATEHGRPAAAPRPTEAARSPPLQQMHVLRPRSSGAYM